MAIIVTKTQESSVNRGGVAGQLQPQVSGHRIHR